MNICKYMQNVKQNIVKKCFIKIGVNFIKDVECNFFFLSAAYLTIQLSLKMKRWKIK